MARAADGRILRLDTMTRRQPTPIALDVDADTRAAIMADLGLPGLGRLRIEGAMIPEGADDWRLEARVTAQAVQECVVSLAPVPAAIDERITRRYLAHLPPPPEGESEMPDEDAEEIPRALDLVAIAREELALALPPWPRAAGIDTDAWDAPPPGDVAEAPQHPFAGLAALRTKGGGDKG
ncbi:MAG: DUF177 domain-containing protein [Rubellimicrobium sp.]|nr:DUF177 domain-containing protein [Rubellimicrobium sp.]